MIWALDSPSLLSKRAFAALAESRNRCELSVISLSEIAIKQSIGKLDLSRQEVGLPLHHPNPSDRPIIAQALAENIPVVTPNDKFKLYQGVKVIW